MPDHAQCHRDIDQLLAEIARLRAALTMCAEAGREAAEALVYTVERTEHNDGSITPQGG
jgi:hypothetical protein